MLAIKPYETYLHTDTQLFMLISVGHMVKLPYLTSLLYLSQRFVPSSTNIALWLHIQTASLFWVYRFITLWNREHISTWEQDFRLVYGYTSLILATMEYVWKLDVLPTFRGSHANLVFKAAACFMLWLYTANSLIWEGGPQNIIE